MKRAALIFTEHKQIDVTTGWGYGKTAHYECVPTSEQLLADPRTLAALPDNLALGFTDPRLRYADVQVDVDDWEEAKAAAARVRALLPQEDEDE